MTFFGPRDSQPGCGREDFVSSRVERHWKGGGRTPLNSFVSILPPPQVQADPKLAAGFHAIGLATALLQTIADHALRLMPSPSSFSFGFLAILKPRNTCSHTENSTLRPNGWELCDTSRRGGAVPASQGALILRGYVERFNAPRVATFVSIHGPLAGVAGFRPPRVTALAILVAVVFLLQVRPQESASDEA